MGYKRNYKGGIIMEELETVMQEIPEEEIETEEYEEV